MAVYSTSAKARTLAEFLKDYWYIVLGAIVALPWVIKYIKSMSWDLAKQTEEHQKDVDFGENRDPVKLATKQNNVLSRYGIQANSIAAMNLIGITNRLIQASGVNHWDTDHWWDKLDPRGWSEDDTEIYNAFIDLADHEPYSSISDGFNIVTELYNQMTRRRILVADMSDWLDGSEMKKLREKEYYRLLF